MNLPTIEQAAVIGIIGVYAAPAVIVGWYLCDTAVRANIEFLQGISLSLLNMIGDLSDCSESLEKPDGPDSADT